MARTALLSLAAAGFNTMASASFPLGCTSTDLAYSDTIANMSLPLSSTTPEGCQEECARLDNCTHFAYYPNDECWLADSNVQVLRETRHNGVIAGPKVCQEPAPACTETPAMSFPGTSEHVDWPDTGYQPQRLQCFPATCDTVVTLESTTDGWAGACKNLTQVNLTAGETCEQKCRDDVHCPSYQVGEDGNCWIGVGWNCDTERAWDSHFVPREAKRFMRGGVRVLKDLAGLRVPDLEMAFNASEMSVLSDPATACKNICYSMLECEYWQLNNRSDTGGCWVDQAQSVPYPLFAVNMLPADATWVAGEFIQRTCPEAESLGEEEVEEGSMPIWLLGLLIALGVICAGVAGYLAYSAFVAKRQKPKTTRAAKRALKGPLVKAEEPAPAQPQQQAQLYHVYPVQAQSYAVPVYQAAPVTTVSREIPVAAASPIMSMQTVAQPVVQAQPVQMVQQPVQLQYAAPVAAQAQPLMQFQTVDTNNDGVITRDEFMSAMARPQ